MQAVKVTADAEAFLSALQDITTRVVAKGPEQTIHLGLDLIKKTIALLDEDADSVYKITLPVRVVPTGESKRTKTTEQNAAPNARKINSSAVSNDMSTAMLYCRVPVKKLAPLHHLFRTAEGSLSIICRKTTLSFQYGKKQYLMPNQLVKRPDSDKMVVPNSDPNPFLQKTVVRFAIADLEKTRQALKTCSETALPVRVSKGVVVLHTETFATDPRLNGLYLWPKQALQNRLEQMPAGLQVQVISADHTPVYLTAQQGGEQSQILREIWLRPIPTTTLYISKPQTEKKPGHEESSVWKNRAFLARQEQQQELHGETNGEGSYGSYTQSQPLDGQPNGERSYGLNRQSQQSHGQLNGEGSYGSNAQSNPVHGQPNGEAGFHSNQPLPPLSDCSHAQSNTQQNPDLTSQPHTHTSRDTHAMQSHHLHASQQPHLTQHQDAFLSPKKNNDPGTPTPYAALGHSQNGASLQPDDLFQESTTIPYPAAQTLLSAQTITVEETEDPPFSKEAALAQLEELPGLALVKKQIREVAEFAYFEKQRAKIIGIPSKPISLHMSFLGNPGTGKTMVARMAGRIFKTLGLISKGHVVEVDRQMLVGAYMGHTEANLAKYVKKAQGGILFVDEAYTLYKKDSSKDFGLTAINGLLKILEDQRENLVVILAGYKREMNEFFAFNPGLRERVPFHIEFSDYSEQELLQIANFIAAEDHYRLTDEAKSVLLKQLMREKIDETFGNARTVRNWIEKAKIQHAVRAAEGDLSEEDYTTLAADDFQLEDEAVRSETLEQVLTELDQLVGLDDVKRLVRQMVDLLAVEQKRSAFGLADSPLTFHMVFTGGAGTGKTTVARLLGRLFRAMNLLPKGHFVETSRKDLVAGFVGQTALKTAEKIKEALGGILFLDEAYALQRRGRDEFGAEALATLIKEMEDKKGLFTVILAGYTKEMEALFKVNPGLRSRIRFELNFPDYTASELVEIVKKKAEAAQYLLTEAAEEKLWRCFLQACLDADDNFGNGRLAEKVFEQAKIRLSTRVIASEEEALKEALMTITADDIVWDFAP